MPHESFLSSLKLLIPVNKHLKCIICNINPSSYTCDTCNDKICLHCYATTDIIRWKHSDANTENIFVLVCHACKS